MLPFDYTLDGHITHVHRDPARTWRQDPGWPVPPEITRITGLTDEDLAGQAIDAAAASELLARSHLVVAHNASFDRSFVEAVVPAAREVAWACSRHEVGDPVAFPSRSLACLLCAYGAFAPDRHRALADCEAGVWLLTQTLPGTERTVFGELRETAARPAVRIWATGAPLRHEGPAPRAGTVRRRARRRPTPPSMSSGLDDCPDSVGAVTAVRHNPDRKEGGGGPSGRDRG